MKALVAMTLSMACSLAFAAPPLPACDETATAPLSFRAAKARDTITVTIRGAPCYEAALSLRITSDTGKTLYAYEAPFKKHVATHWEDLGLPNDAAQLAKRIAKQDEKKTTSALPPWLPEADYYEEHYNVIKVTKERYEQLRQKNLPIFTHPTHYEQWQSVIYDSNTGQAELLFVGGL